MNIGSLQVKVTVRTTYNGSTIIAEDYITIEPDTSVIVKYNPESIAPGDTTELIIRKVLYGGSIVNYSPLQSFEVGMINGCALGKLNKDEVDTNYLYGVTQPVYFIADSSADSGVVKVKVGLIIKDWEVTGKIVNSKNQNIQSKVENSVNEYCFIGNFKSVIFGEGNVVVEKKYELEILEPTSTSEEWITPEPNMPQVICKARLKNYDKGNISFEWEYWISYTLLRHEYKSIDTLMRRTGKIQICGKSYSNNSEISSWTVPFDKDSLKYVLLTVKQPEIPDWSQYGGDNNEKRTNWEEGDEIFFGGDVFLQITAKNNNGNILGFKQQNSGKIIGKNPFLQDVLNYITSKEFKAIVKHEAKSKQFNDNHINKYNGKGYPIYGPPNGYGLAQIDNPPPLEMDLWNWKSNLNRGKSIYDDKKIDAYNFMEEHPNTYTEEMLLKCAFQKYNMNGYQKDTKIIHYYWRWDNYQGKWVDDEYIIERTKALGFKERYGITIWNIYKSL
jgi:hypothetical protein